jgi:hypothetical protein
MTSRYEQLLEALLNDETADIVPQSRSEELLLAMINGEKPTGTPMSRNEALLMALCEKGTGGGSGGSGGDSALLICNFDKPTKDHLLEAFVNARINFAYAETFEQECFYDSVAISEAVAPKAKVVGEGAFCNCANLRKIDMPLVTAVMSSGFDHCNTLSVVNLPSAKIIGGRAFADCWMLKKIDLPAVEDIGPMAFDECEQLTTVILRTTETVCVCDLTAFVGTPLMQGAGHIYVPTVMYEYYRAGYETAINDAMGAGAFDFLFRKIEDYPEICGG